MGVRPAAAQCCRLRLRVKRAQARRAQRRGGGRRVGERGRPLLSWWARAVAANAQFRKELPYQFPMLLIHCLPAAGRCRWERQQQGHPWCSPQAAVVRREGPTNLQPAPRASITTAG